MLSLAAVAADMAALQRQNLAGAHADEDRKMRDDALALVQCVDVVFHLLFVHGLGSRMSPPAFGVKSAAVGSRSA